MSDRRIYLRGLASLPLIGGGVTLIGSPTAAAVPVTPKLLDAYDEWLDLERSWLTWERFGRAGRERRYGDDIEVVWRDRITGKAWTITCATDFSGFDHTNAASRAAVVLRLPASISWEVGPMSDVHIAISRMEDDVLSTIDFLNVILVVAEANCRPMSLPSEGQAAGLVRVFLEALIHANAVKESWLKLFEMSKPPPT